jgi:hypothetical protein
LHDWVCKDNGPTAALVQHLVDDLGFLLARLRFLLQRQQDGCLVKLLLRAAVGDVPDGVQVAVEDLHQCVDRHRGPVSSCQVCAVARLAHHWRQHQLHVHSSNLIGLARSQLTPRCSYASHGSQQLADMPSAGGVAMHNSEVMIAQARNDKLPMQHRPSNPTYLGCGGYKAQSKRSSQLSEHVAEQLGMPAFQELWICQALLQHGLLLQDPAFQVACYA